MVVKQLFGIISVILILGITTHALAGTEVLPAQIVELDSKIHFHSPRAENVVIPAGKYALEAAAEALRLVSAEGGDVFLIQAKFATHAEEVSEPVARVIPINKDVHYLVLLLPDGQSLEALGSHTGVWPRGALQENLRKAKSIIEEEKERPEETAVLEMEPDCINLSPKRDRPQAKSCPNPKSKKNIGPCVVWDPPKSDRCAAMTNRSLPIDFEFFGQSDCRTNTNKRQDAVTMIVIHNGDHARGNARTWMCRKASSHYTINRDGKIYQHVGEEQVAWHAGGVNRKSIGIELQILRGYGSSCNSIRGSRLTKTANKKKVRPEDIIKELCAPTPAQYASLGALIADIKSRHPISQDGIVGHCEVAKPGGHGDPRAFDWSQIGSSNETKRIFINTHKTACNWYGLY